MNDIGMLITQHLFTPGFAVGVLIGGVGMHGAVHKGLVTTPRMADLQQQVARLEAQLAAARQDLSELKAEFEHFAKWRRELTDKTLGEL